MSFKESLGKVPRAIRSLFIPRVTIRDETQPPQDGLSIQDGLRLIKNSQTSIQVICGEQALKTIKDPQVLSAIEQASERGVKIEIIIDKNTDPELTDQLWGLQRQVSVYQLPEGGPVTAQDYQSILFDGRHIMFFEPEANCTVENYFYNETAQARFQWLKAQASRPYY